MVATVNRPSMSWHEEVADRFTPLVHRSIRSLQQSNVVLHSTMASHARTRVAARYFGKKSNTHIPSSRTLRLASSRGTPSSPFAHHKIRTSVGATILMFNSGQLIRSGGNSPGQALISLLKFVNFLQRTHPATHANAWIGAATIPNSVFTGQFVCDVSPAFKNDSAATYTSKFPGIAINLNIDEKITPELFLRRSKFIIPGIKTAHALSRAADALVSVVQPYFNKESPSFVNQQRT